MPTAVHLVLTVLTCGLWLPIWLLMHLFPAHCSLCGNLLKRTRYVWKADGKTHHLCPSCNQQAERRKSRAAWDEPAARRGRKPADSSGRSGAGSSPLLKVLGVGCVTVTLGLVAVCGAGLAMGWYGLEQAKKELAEANRRWDAGEKAEAVAMYRQMLTKGIVADTSQEPVVYLRVIEYDMDHGATDSARTLTDQALGKGVDLRPDREATAKLVADVRADRERRAADEQARKEAEAKRQQEERAAEAKRREEEREAEAKRREEERKNAPKMSVEILKVRLEPFRTAQGANTHMVCVDWKNTGNRPVRALSVKMRGYDKDDREMEIMPVSDYYIYATAGNDRPGIAPGETYHEPNDEGHVIAPDLDRRVVRVNVKVVRVEEKVAE